MDGIMRKRMQCDSHIDKIGYFGWKKIWRFSRVCLGIIVDASPL
jgi:hypothetical protein